MGLTPHPHLGEHDRMAVELLHYRPWRGTLRASAWSIWPIARSSLGMIFRRKLFWALYGLGLAFFLMFFFGQYLLSFVQAQPGIIGDIIARAKKNISWMDGEAHYYRDFLRLQSSMVMVILALTGSILVGNDFHFNSLTFYLSKPITPRHYLLGKAAAVSVFVNLM